MLSINDVTTNVFGPSLTYVEHSLWINQAKGEAHGYTSVSYKLRNDVSMDLSEFLFIPCVPRPADGSS